MSTVAVNAATNASVEAAMEEVLEGDRPGEVPLPQGDKGDQESPSKRPRQVCDSLCTVPMTNPPSHTRAVEVSHTTVSKPPGAVLPGATLRRHDMAAQQCKKACVVRQVAAESCRLLTCAALRCAALRCAALQSAALAALGA